jgi:hypothetical protein
VKKKHLEVCGECTEFPCSKFNSKWFGKAAYDSFVTHKQAVPNLKFIKQYGIKVFLKQQGTRTRLLEEMLDEFNDGRSKGFYCLSAALLSIEGIEDALKTTRKEVERLGVEGDDAKFKAKILRKILKDIAEKEQVELKLHKPSHWK